jgi:RNA polymerase sigma-70 factor (ECF subfamily)
MKRVITAEDFEKLYGATARDVLAYVRRRTSGDVENLVAEVYAVAWRRRYTLPPPTLRRAWLFGVARTLLKADLRQRQRERELVDQIATHPTPNAGATAENPPVSVVAEALERLSPTDREILRLVTWEQLTPAELAVTLGIRPGTARVRLHRARQALASDPQVKALVEEPDPAMPSTTH